MAYTPQTPTGQALRAFVDGLGFGTLGTVQRTVLGAILDEMLKAVDKDPSAAIRDLKPFVITLAEVSGMVPGDFGWVEEDRAGREFAPLAIQYETPAHTAFQGIPPDFPRSEYVTAEEAATIRAAVQADCEMCTRYREAGEDRCRYCLKAFDVSA
jgi:hypothetical protein